MGGRGLPRSLGRIGAAAGGGIDPRAAGLGRGGELRGGGGAGGGGG